MLLVKEFYGDECIRIDDVHLLSNSKHCNVDASLLLLLLLQRRDDDMMMRQWLSDWTASRQQALMRSGWPAGWLAAAASVSACSCVHDCDDEGRLALRVDVGACCLHVRLYVYCRPGGQSLASTLQPPVGHCDRCSCISLCIDWLRRDAASVPLTRPCRRRLIDWGRRAWNAESAALKPSAGRLFRLLL